MSLKIKKYYIIKCFDIIYFYHPIILFLLVLVYSFELEKVFVLIVKINMVSVQPGTYIFSKFTYENCNIRSNV